MPLNIPYSGSQKQGDQGRITQLATAVAVYCRIKGLAGR